MKAFCDPPITTSRPQPSISSGMVPEAGDGIDDEDRGVFAIAAAMARTSCAAPVEVSDAWMKTPLVAGSLSRASCTCAGVTTCP